MLNNLLIFLFFFYILLAYCTRSRNIFNNKEMTRSTVHGGYVLLYFPFNATVLSLTLHSAVFYFRTNASMCWSVCSVSFFI